MSSTLLPQAQTWCTSLDSRVTALVAGVLSLLIVASVVGYLLGLRTGSERGREVVQNLNARIRAWWVMAVIFFGAIAVGSVGSLLLFAAISFLALREYITLTPTKRADHRALFWAFFVVTPLQYFLIGIRWYGLFTIFIPVYAYLLIPIRIVIAGDCQDFLARTSKIQWGLLVCVYFVSYAPALLSLKFRGYRGEGGELLFFLVAVVQLSDVFQYVFGKCFGRHPIAPQVSPNKTVEGFIGGVCSAVLIGTLLWWITPFTPWQASILSLIVALMGFSGGLVMSAIKRDRGVKDYGSTIPGHGGILDRIDSLCFAAPIFFHLTRYYFT